MATKDYILISAKKNLDELGDKLGKQVGADIKQGGEFDASKLTAVKKSFSESPGLKGNIKIKIPDEVYKEIAEALYDKMDKSIFVTYSKNEGTLIKQVAKQIATVLSSIKDLKVPVDEKDSAGKTVPVTYTVKFSGANLGSRGNFINVSNGTNDSWLNWKDSTDAGKKAMTQYFTSLYNLGKKVTEAKKLIADTLIENGAKVFSAIFGRDDSILSKIFGSGAFKKISKEYATDKIEKVFDSIIDKKIKTAVSQYKTLNTAYKNLETEVNSSKSTLKSIQSKATAFTNAANKVQSSLTSLGVSVLLGDLPNLSAEPLYNSNYTEVTVPSGWFGSFKSTTKKIYCGEWTVPVKITCGSLDNIVIGGTAKNTIYGYGGNDSLVGGKSDDYIYGGVGNDTLVGNAGNDYLDGDNGNDKLYGGNGKDTLYGGSGNDTLSGGAGDDYLDVTSGNNYLDGGKDKDTLWGGYNDDILFGGEGDDKLYGYYGNDSLNGGQNSDSLYGGAGNDTLNGGKGNDSLWGGAGADIFVYKPGEGTDKIYDYESNDMLKILKSDGKAGGTFTKATFESGNNKLVLKISGGGYVGLFGVSAGDKININGKVRTISGTTLK